MFNTTAMIDTAEKGAKAFTAYIQPKEVKTYVESLIALNFDYARAVLPATEKYFASLQKSVQI